MVRSLQSYSFLSPTHDVMLLDTKGRRSGCVLQQAGEKFRRLACAYAEKHLYKSAVFWADKVVSILDAQPDDVFFFARTLFLDGQYARAADMLTRRNLHFTNDACRILAADALSRCRLFGQAEAVMFSCYDEDITATNVSGDRASRLTSYSRVGKSGEEKASVQKRSEPKSTALTPLNSVSTASAAMPPPAGHSGGPNSVVSRLLRCSASKTTSQWSPLSTSNFPMSSSTPKAASVTPVVKPPAAPTPRANTNSAKRGALKSVFPTFSINKEAWVGIEAREALVKAQIAEGGDNRIGAAEYYKEALMHDPFCQEAFQSLVKSFMLSPTEENAILDVLSWNTQMTQSEINLVKALYCLAVRRVDARTDLPPIPDEFAERFETNTDVMLWRARTFFADNDYRHALKIVKAVQSLDPHHPGIPEMYIACLLELKDVNELFRIAHDLVDKMPEESLTWYAVGCYYYLTNKLEPSRRYLLKATTLDRYNGSAWLMYGHAFAVDGEHDQAMSAYYKAHHIMRGCHLPLLYVGLGYESSKSYILAREFFLEALSIAPNDPFTLHELGVVCYSEKRFDEAEKYMRAALAQVDRSNRLTPFPEKWEPLLNNLGHVCRKLDKVDEALKYYRRALSVKPKTASTYAAIGYLLAWRGQLWSAASNFHQALALRRDDTLSTELLNHVVEALAEDDEVPYLRGPVGPDGPDIAARDLEAAIGPMKKGVKKELKEEEEKFKKMAMKVGNDPAFVCDGVATVKVQPKKPKSKSRAPKKDGKKSESRTTQTLQANLNSPSGMDMSVSMESV